MLARSSGSSDPEQKSLSRAAFEQFRCEMEEMRSASRAELLKAWAEIEQLEDEKEDLKHQQLKLVSLLQASTEREGALMVQLDFLKAEITKGIGNRRPNHGLETSWNSDGGLPARSICSSISNISLPSECTDVVVGDATTVVLPQKDTRPPSTWIPNCWHSPLQKEQQRENALARRLQRVEHLSQESITVWKGKVAHGNAVLRIMEEARQTQVETIELLLQQLNMQDNQACQRENDLKKQIFKLKKEACSNG